MDGQQQDPEHIWAVQERRRSGAGGGRDSRPGRKRTRKTAKYADIKEER